eukprot:m.141152 g.141152  ORF g.141152 m.141152 type:complete len:1449 (+) comp38332_c0_seq4:89-4435(+)
MLTIILSLFGVALAAQNDFASQLKAVHLAWLEKDKAAIADVAFPERVNAAGESLGDRLYPFSTRRRRAIDGQGVDNLFYKLKSHGDDFLMRLQANGDLISPKALMQTMNGDQVETEPFDHEKMTGCHLHGSVTRLTLDSGNNTLPDGRGYAAVSVCDGNMTGVMKFDGFDLFIEPTVSEVAGTCRSRCRSHVVYKRSSGGANGGEEDFCHVHAPGDVSHRRHHGGHQHRQRRASSDTASTEKFYVETMLVVDSHVMRRHESFGHDDNKVREYVLTLMNIVHTLFNHHVTGYDASFPVVRFILLKAFPNSFSYTRHSIKLIERFCQWQNSINVANTSHPYHHDYAIFLTGQNLCAHNFVGCGELGRAYLSAHCLPKYSCQLAVDSGMRTGFVLAHEIGHGFGMRHDGDTNGCSPGEGNVMSPHVSGKANLNYWSSCSVDYMRDYVESQSKRLQCLHDPPHRGVVWSTSSPGEKFSLDQQCAFQIGNRSAKFCNDSLNLVCSQLYCSNGDRCRTVHIPAVDGSRCSPNKVCVKGQCVPKARMDDYYLPSAPVQGSWNVWSAFGSCSRTCGSGIRVRTRRCNNPRPRNGGATCPELSYEIELCKRVPCNPSADWRKERCSYYIDYNGNHLMKYYIENNPCRLTCYDRARKRVSVKIAITDGLKCRENSNDRCFQGICHSFGCDNIWKSSVGNDECGVCGGKGETCRLLKKKLTGNLLPQECREVANWAAGEKRIDVRGTLHEKAYLALQIKGVTVFDSRLFPDGQYVEKLLAGSIVQYLRKSSRYWMTIADPLETWLILKVCNLIKSNVSVDVKVRSASPTGLERLDVDALKYIYMWRRSSSSCSASCKGGQRTVEYHCYVPAFDVIVPSYFCYYDGDDKEPKKEVVPCNSDVICSLNYKPTYVWSPLPWRPCSKTCGTGRQTRAVPCQTLEDKRKKVDKKLCKGERPEQSRPCNLGRCPVDGGWSEWRILAPCSQSCGRGVSAVGRTCTNPRPVVDGEDCIGESVRYSLCNEEPCPVNYPEAYSGQCISKLGQGARVVYYSRDVTSCKISCIHQKMNKTIPASNGTRCSFQRGVSSFCLRGQCKSVSCNGNFTDVSVQLDRCGVCGGDSSTCQYVKRPYRLRNVLPGNYSIWSVQAGAYRVVMHVIFKTPIPSSVIISLKNARGDVVFNSSDFNGKSSGIGTGFDAELYYREKNASYFVISSSGKLMEDAKIEMTVSEFLPADSVPKIDVNYFIDSVIARPQNIVEKYDWLWTKPYCGVKCGEGPTVYLPQCSDKATGKPTDERFCADLKHAEYRVHGRCFEPCHPKTPRPSKTTRPPKTPRPPKTTRPPTTETSRKEKTTTVTPTYPTTPVSNLKWFYFPMAWNQCSVTCGVGMRRRTVLCYEGDVSRNRLVHSEKCEQARLAKFVETARCQRDPCPPGSKPCIEPPYCIQVLKLGFCDAFKDKCCSCT